jgi:hypothetical protein
MRRFYLKSAMGMAEDYLCVTCPLSGMDNSAQRPGALMDLIRGIFPGIDLRGGISEDASLQWMLRAAPEAAVAHASRALSDLSQSGASMKDFDAAALAGLCLMAKEDPSLCWLLQSAEQMQRRGFSASGRTEQTNQLPVRDLKGKIVDRDYLRRTLGA